MKNKRIFTRRLCSLHVLRGRMNQQTQTRSYGKIVIRFTSCSTRTSLLFESISAERRFISNGIAAFLFWQLQVVFKALGIFTCTITPLYCTISERRRYPARARVNRFVVNATICHPHEFHYVEPCR